jgi:hypothetical protein
LLLQSCWTLGVRTGIFPLFIPAYFPSQGLGIYVAINILGAIILLFGTVIYIIYSLIKCCCCRKPAIPPPEDLKKKRRVEYCRITVSILAVIGVPLVFLLSTLMGTYGISSSSESLTTASTGAKNLISSMEPGITGLFVSSAATILAPTISNFNITLTSAVDVILMAQSMDDINRTVPLLPDTARMIDALVDVRFIATNTCQVPLDNLVALSDELVNQNNQLSNLVITLIDDVDDIKAANTRILSSLSHGQKILNETEDTMMDLFGTTDLPVIDDSLGLLGGIKSDLNKIQRAPSGAIPTTTVFTAASDSMTDLLSGALNNSVAGLGTLNGQLTPIYNNMSALPNFTTTGNNILKVNRTIHSMLSPGGLFDQVPTALNAISNNISAYPSLNPIYHHLDSLDILVHNLNISGAISLLEVLTGIFRQVPPQLTVLSQELEQIRLLNVILPALEALTDQLYGFNASIIKLPATLSKISDAYDTINKTASDVMSQVDDIQDRIDTANTTVTGYIELAEQYIVSSTEEKNRLNDALATYNLTEILLFLNSTTDTLDSIDFSTVLTQLTNFESSLSSFSLPKTLSDAMFTLQDSVEGMNTLLKRAVDPSAGGKTGATKGDYLRLHQGYCANDEASYCSSDADCSSSTCVAQGSYRCTEKGSHRCDADSSCSSVSSSSYCLADSSRATSLKNYLVAFSNTNALPSVSSYSSLITSLQTSSTISLSSASDLVKDGIHAVNQIDYTVIDDALAEIKQAIKDYNYTKEAAEIKNTILDAQSEITDIPILDYVDLLQSFADDFQSFLDDQYDVLVRVTKVMKTFRNFLFSSDGLRARLQQFSQSNLDSIVVSQGPSAMIDHIAYQFDLMSDYFMDSDLGLNSPNFTKKSGDNFNFLDKMGAYEVSGYGDMAENGPNYYLMRLFESSKKTVLSTAGLLSGVFADSQGERYPGGAYCTIDKCQDHTLEVLNSAPMNQWQDEFPGVDLSMLDSITYSREELMMYLWAPTLLLWFIGLIAFICHFTTSKCGQSVEKYSAGCYLACICCQLPIIFLLTAFFFVMIVMVSDGCNSYAVIGDRYITEYGDPFCHNVFGGNGTLQHCVIDTDLPNYMSRGNFSVTVDIISVYRAIFENECKGSGPFEGMLDSIGDQIYDIPPEFTRHFINSTGQFTLRPPMIDVSVNGTARVGMVLRDYLHEQAETTLTCEKIAAVVNDLHTDTCGSIVPALLWCIGPWYLCAWILCCCSLPSACLLGRDRKNSSIHPSDERQPGGGAHREENDEEPEEFGDEEVGAMSGGGGGGRDNDDMVRKHEQFGDPLETSL